MLYRLLSMLGLSWYLPSSSYGLSSSESGLAPDTEGETQITFTPTSTDSASGDDGDSLDEQHARAAGKGTVWPGKTSTIRFRNEFRTAYKFELTVLGLSPHLYQVQLPLGGEQQEEGVVVLQPEETATFEVRFISREQMPRRAVPIRFVMTRFDPRRSREDGKIVQEIPAKWVVLPSGRDIQLTAEPAVVVLRPWRRTALIRLRLNNGSHLPPTVRINLRRALSKEALGDPEKSEPIGAITQTLSPRASGVWHCLLPPHPQKASYLATATGTVRVAEQTDHSVNLPKPIVARYIPWLRRGRDWVFLLGSIFFLIWLVYGIPILQTPVIYVRPAGINNLEWFKFSLTPRSGTSMGQPVDGVVDRHDTTQVVFTLPSRWRGYRWPFGWGPFSRSPLEFELTASGAGGEHDEEIKERYALPKMQTGDGIKTLFEVNANASEYRSFSTTWDIRNVIARLPLKSGVKIDLFIDDIGYARDQKKSMRVIAKLDEREVFNEPFPLKLGQVQAEIPIPSKGFKSGQLSVMAVTEPYRSESNVVKQDIQASTASIPVHLRFPAKPTEVTCRIAASSYGAYTLQVTLPSGRKETHGPDAQGVVGSIDIEVEREGGEVIFQVTRPEDNSVGVKIVKLTTTEKEKEVQFEPAQPLPASNPPSGSETPGGPPGGT